ncbi:hypothetical protein LMG3458_00452 [Achromobacter deleyi]|uniref:Helix-hairpin-helix DNA-binding motif class 1 domain-containing protein n=1 Tax=Achromobacter deleyi TaxID=1353891 RepID=A0A6S6Z239_9BURK|nr:hypothetical protein LMG3458_00452 [Achromobacter deleyi]CAB3894133.1 hypothetical protein LMG3481_03925 [Achromobacter deleyi]CAB3920591.1 hypothetical protein LMG3482_05381 [Achromobacter deleyi]
MNPFLHSTVAADLATHVANPAVLHVTPHVAPRLAAPWRRPRTAASAARRVLRLALGTALLAAGLVSAPAHAVDVNGATAQQLEGIRGIGPRTAETIVRERDRGGKFESLQDLAERVRGISAKKAQALEAAGLTVGGAPAAKSAVAPDLAANPARSGAKPAMGAAGAAGPASAKAGVAAQSAKPPATARPRP